MNTYTNHTDAAARCAFCVRPLAIVNGELQRWRAANGLCKEFCADDFEEARFQSYHRSDRRAGELPACPSPDIGARPAMTRCSAAAEKTYDAKIIARTRVPKGLLAHVTCE
jgi:hypothetical protein